MSLDKIRFIDGPRKADTRQVYSIDGTLSEVVRALSRVRVESAELDFDNPDMIAKPKTVVRAGVDPETGLDIEHTIPAMLRASEDMRGVRFLQIDYKTLKAEFPGAVSSDGALHMGHILALLLCAMQESVAAYDALVERLSAADASGDHNDTPDGA